MIGFANIPFILYYYLKEEIDTSSCLLNSFISCCIYFSRLVRCELWQLTELWLWLVRESVSP